MRLFAGRCAHTDPQKVPEAFEERTRLFLLAQRGGGATGVPKGHPPQGGARGLAEWPISEHCELSVAKREEQGVGA